MRFWEPSDDEALLAQDALGGTAREKAARLSTVLGYPVSEDQVRNRLKRLRPVEPVGDGFVRTVIISDTQYPWVDEAAEAALMEYVAQTQPDQLIQIGDFIDLYSLATFRKGVSPSERMYLREEVKVGKAKLREWGDLVPKARKVLIEGNHEGRLARYLEDNGPELFDLSDNLSVPALLGTEEAGWEYIGPYGEGLWVGQPGGLWATHGELVRKWSGVTAHAHVEKYGHSVIHGHTHRLGSFYQTRQGANGPVSIGGFEVGCLCSFTKTPRASSIVDWQHGFAVVYTSKTSARFHVDLVSIVDGGFVYGGKRYGR
jgi:predicted phosphodiesterase